MTTVTEIKTDYEPTAADRIQRVLYRLAHGEELYDGRLRTGEQFCVLGLFADESGQVKWEPEIIDRGKGPITLTTMHYIIGDEMYISRLDPSLVKYYNLIDDIGTFDIDNVPVELQNDIKELLPHGNYNLMRLNDNAIRIQTYTTEQVNSLLAAVIRSGAIFKE